MIVHRSDEEDYKKESRLISRLYSAYSVCFAITIFQQKAVQNLESRRHYERFCGAGYLYSTKVSLLFIQNINYQNGSFSQPTIRTF